MSQYNNLSKQGAAIGRMIVSTPPSKQVAELWPSNRSATSYWVLLISGVNQKEELKIAVDLLIWNAFFSKEVAQAVCVSSNENHILRLFANRYQINEVPSIVFGTEPEMPTALVIGGSTLRYLSSKEGSLQNFLDTVQLMVYKGWDISAIHSYLRKEKIWNDLKLLWKE